MQLETITSHLICTKPIGGRQIEFPCSRQRAIPAPSNSCARGLPGNTQLHGSKALSRGWLETQEDLGQLLRVPPPSLVQSLFARHSPHERLKQKAVLEAWQGPR